MNLQDSLTQARRDALWRQLRPGHPQQRETPWDPSRHQGKREEQVSFSAWALILCGCALVGVAVGACMATWQGW